MSGENEIVNGSEHPPTISFDLDGVLANFTRGFTRIAHRLFDTPVGDEQSQRAWMFEDFPELGLTKEQCDFHTGPVWAEIKQDPNFWAELDPLNPSVMKVISLIKNKIFITNRFGVDVKEQSIWFLQRWGVSNPVVIVASDKGPVAQAHNVVAHTDDYLPNCVRLRESLPNAFITIHSAPYNFQWQQESDFPVSLSVEHFISECNRRGLIQWACAPEWYEAIVKKAPWLRLSSLK